MMTVEQALQFVPFVERQELSDREFKMYGDEKVYYCPETMTHYVFSDSEQTYWVFDRDGEEIRFCGYGK
jgi:hypothetical protein